jgi:uncharacterized protein involved in exopolysaccharide biosynthesis
MDLMKLPSILWRWRWVIATVVAVTGIALSLHLRSSRAIYDAQVTLQITDPGSEQVLLFDDPQRSSSFLRDDLVLVRNNLTAVVHSGEVHYRTVQQLELQGPDRAYQVDVRPLIDSNFITLVVSARNPDLAQTIANTHATQSIQYYGELRAKPAAATAELLDAQLKSAKESLASSDQQFGPTLSPSRTGASTPSPSASAATQQGLDTYQLLLKKHAEAVLAEQNALKATYIQIAEPATAPSQSTFASKLVTLIGLWLVGSSGLAVLVALVLEAVFGSRRLTHAPVASQAVSNRDRATVPAQAGELANGARR